MSIYHLLSSENCPPYYPSDRKNYSEALLQAIDYAVVNDLNDERIMDMNQYRNFGGQYDNDTYISTIFDEVWRLRTAGKPIRGSPLWNSMMVPTEEEWTISEFKRKQKINERRDCILEKCNELAEDFAKKPVDEIASIYATSNVENARWLAITKFLDPKKLGKVKDYASKIRHDLMYSTY